MKTSDLVQSAMLSALIIALGFIPPIPIGLIPVPIHAQSLGVMLAGLVLGSKRGMLAVTIFIGVAALGFPVLSGGRGGLQIFFSAPTGYLIGFIPAAFCAGFVAEHWVRERQPRPIQLAVFFLAAVVGGIVIDHSIGIAWLIWFVGLPLDVAFLGNLAFVPGDLIKAVIAAGVAGSVLNHYPLLNR